MKQHKPLRILDQESTSEGWEFVAAINGFTYAVTLEKSYYQQLTDGQVEPKRLVEASMSYLLAKEKPEQILREFNLRQIKQYFPSYETDIKQQL